MCVTIDVDSNCKHFFTTLRNPKKSNQTVNNKNNKIENNFYRPIIPWHGGGRGLADNAVSAVQCVKSDTDPVI